MTDNSSIDLSVTNIWRSWRAFRRGKKPSRAITIFEAELERNLLRLCADLNNGNYMHGPYDHKIVNEKKRRDIAVAQVRDRVVHRLLYDYLVPIIDKRLDFDVWSCRKGKGLHEALARTQKLAAKYSNVWAWRADIEKFFDNVDHQVLKNCLRRIIDDAVALNLLDEVIASYNCPASQPASQPGIPIGNLTSQIFANVYLNEFDRFIRQKIRPLGYIRYGDDFVLFMPNAQMAADAQKVSSAWLRDNLHLRVHSRSDLTFKTRQGLHFLGHKIYPASPVSVDTVMYKKVNQRINVRNAASYKAMYLSKKYSKRLPWLLIDSPD